MRTLTRRRRGQAAVELAVTMVVIVPLTMYVLFLQDYLSYYLDWQEAIVTSSWDFAAYDYGKSDALKSSSINRGDMTASFNNNKANNVKSGVSEVAQNNRYEFCDHSSAYTSFDIDYDCSEGKHHQAMAAHQCWLVANKSNRGRQVTCFIDSSPGNLIEPINGGSINRGGLGSCTAALGAQNYFIIHSFITPDSKTPGKHVQVLEETGNADQTKGVYKGNTTGKIHSNSNLGYGWIMGAPGSKSEDYFGIITDPWAVKTTKKHDPDSKTDDDFQARVDKYFNLYGIIPGGLANLFGIDLAGDDLIGYQALTDSVVGDNPLTSTLAWQDDQTKDINSHYASGWNDRQSSDYDSRKDGYMSKEDSSW